MKFLKNLKKIFVRPVVLTVGNFDGLHLGHRAIISRVVAEAKKTGSDSLVLTFQPHPQQVLGEKGPVKFLNSLAEKIWLFEGTGLNYLVQLPFTEKLSRWSAEKFFIYLSKFFKIKKLVAGFDFALGAGKSAGLLELEGIGYSLGFEVRPVPAEKYKNRVISSSLIRRLLRMGKLERAVAKLGGFYPIFGRVVRGRGLGRRLGFPTANLTISADKLLPSSGVYLAVVEIGGHWYRALVNIAREKAGSVVEVFLLDFSGNLYNRRLKVLLVKMLRPEKKFKKNIALSRQIERDVKRAKKFFKRFSLGCCDSGGRPKN